MIEEKIIIIIVVICWFICLILKLKYSKKPPEPKRR